MSAFKSIAVAGAILLLGALFPTPTAKAQYINDTAELLKQGNDKYDKNCVAGSKFYFAYIQRQQTIAYDARIRLLQRISDCERGHTGTASNDGKYDDPNAPPTSNPKEKRCGAYAVLAVTAQRINQRAGCGNGGNRWSTDYDSHYNWCMDASVSAAALRAENTARSNALNSCVFN